MIFCLLSIIDSKRETYLKTLSNHFKTSHSQIEDCTIIQCDIGGLHKMRQRHAKCKCSPDCQLKYKSISCSSQELHVIFIGQISEFLY